MVLALRGGSAEMITLDSLGIRRIINANATLTALGGSLMPDVVIESMTRAAKAFVDMHELQMSVSRRIAQLTRNEAALVVSGASAGLLLSTLASMTQTNLSHLAVLLERGAGALARNQVVMHRSQRIPYDNVITLAGAEVVEIGNALQTFPWELEGAINDRTAAILYVAGVHLESAAIPLPEVIAVAKRSSVPVIVDAAAQLPPRENLWRFTEQGADLVLFSGGKELRGPQASGLILGSAEWIESCALHAAPLQRFGRPAKVGKEEMVGLLAAVEWWMDQDLDEIKKRVEDVTRYWVESISSINGMNAVRDYPSEAGRPLPRALVGWEQRSGPPAVDVARLLREGTPPIDIAIAGSYQIWLNAELLEPGDEEIVLARLREILASETGEA